MPERRITVTEAREAAEAALVRALQLTEVPEQEYLIEEFTRLLGLELDSLLSRPPDKIPHVGGRGVSPQRRNFPE